MLDVLMITMSLIVTFTMVFLAHLLYQHHLKIVRLEAKLLKFKQICANLNIKKDDLESDIRRLRARYQELWVKYNESEENCKVISKLQLETNDSVINYMKMVDSLVHTLSYVEEHMEVNLKYAELSYLYFRLKKRGRLLGDVYDTAPINPSKEQ